MSEQNETLPAEVSQELSRQTIFSKDVNEMTFSELARFNGIMQAVKKAAKSKRGETRSRLEEGLREGTTNAELRDKGEHSVEAIVPGVNISLMDKEYSKLDNDAAVELLRDKNVDFGEAEEQGLIEKSVDVDVESLLDELDEKGVDYSDHVENVSYDVNEDKLEMLVSFGQLQQSEVDECYVKKSRSRFRCTLEKEYKQKVINTLQGVSTTSSVESEDKEETSDLDAETLQEVDGVGEELAGRILDKVS
jgi:hypothetical protein